jgi:hypothetical protein
MCAPQVTRHTSIRYSSSCHTHQHGCIDIRTVYVPPLPRDLADLNTRITAAVKNAAVICAGRAKEIRKIRAAVNGACRGNLSACHSGHTCHTFGSPGLDNRLDGPGFNCQLPPVQWVGGWWGHSVGIKWLGCEGDYLASGAEVKIEWSHPPPSLCLHDVHEDIMFTFQKIWVCDLYQLDTWRLKTNSHIPCRSAKGLDCVFPI